jgi:carnitine 3-dehydrogenase
MDAPAIQRAAVVATGVIGASWTTVFLARGLDVTAADPAPGAEEALRRAVEAQWPAMDAMGGVAPGASPDRHLRFAASPEEAVADAQFVQENGPERLDLKRELFRRLDGAAPANAILATSSSTITVSEIQGACARHPERVVLGHPFNPPHLIPLVEVAGGRATTAEAVERALGFYRALGKHPIHLRREVRGHVANRLQAALWQEAFHLVATGVASVADVDAAISEGPGLRWALMGPNATLHLAGGDGGMAHFMRHLQPAMEGWWRTLGEPEVTPELQAKLIAGVAEVTGGAGTQELARRRDAALARLLAARAAG